MLTPQFSLRRLLFVVTVCAVLCLVPAVATRGYVWAIAAAFAMAGIGVLFAIQALLYVVSRGLGAALSRGPTNDEP
ncbi:MAG: hypothetical protein DWQ37_18905 [Planctomycetota bacterium]|nr:MAG: hypothetical protein DWQ37_18905 [Planctomycetota bacterium]